MPRALITSYSRIGEKVREEALAALAQRLPRNCFLAANPASFRAARAAALDLAPDKYLVDLPTDASPPQAVEHERWSKLKLNLIHGTLANAGALPERMHR
jgi:hypothetical protein